VNKAELNALNAVFVARFISQLQLTAPMRQNMTRIIA